ncbi:MAG: LbtU family siderophore porin [Verrucomicrobiota bacterium]
MKKGIVAGLVVALLLTGNALAAGEEHTHPHPGPVANGMEGRTVPQNILNNVDVGFLVELEGFSARAGDVSESDITLATVELTVDADVVDGVTAHLGLLWEEDDTEENILDEGYITFGATEEIPFYATAGKMYLPFGNFESAFISDPLTLEMAEINQSAALVGFGNSWVDLNVGAFNGDFEEGAADNTIDDVFASIEFTLSESVVLGAYWLSDLLETDGFEDFAGVITYETIGGAGAFLNAQLGPVVLNLEYVSAIERLNPLAAGLLPSAYNVEASMPVHEKVSVGIKFEGSDDFYSEFVGTPTGKQADWQTGFVVSYDLNEHVVLSGEYLHADGLDGDESGDMATVQVALVL